MSNEDKKPETLQHKIIHWFSLALVIPFMLTVAVTLGALMISVIKWAISTL